ncbi:unnamed protein product [Soboliphyme baturini]|uniref:Uncharacterized protein n=1 Tax=Soboliphyme baturini TaxID=241478 RepID=A0A3P8B0V9_9BILA|nr:unnamed protein product [Soboliphyme baturini]
MLGDWFEEPSSGGSDVRLKLAFEAGTSFRRTQLFTPFRFASTPNLSDFQVNVNFKAVVDSHAQNTVNAINAAFDTFLVLRRCQHQLAHLSFCDLMNDLVCMVKTVCEFWNTDNAYCESDIVSLTEAFRKCSSTISKLVQTQSMS